MTKEFDLECLLQGGFLFPGLRWVVAYAANPGSL